MGRDTSRRSDRSSSAATAPTSCSTACGSIPITLQSSANSLYRSSHLGQDKLLNLEENETFFKAVLLTKHIIDGLKRDGIRLNLHRALDLCLSGISSVKLLHPFSYHGPAPMRPDYLDLAAFDALSRAARARPSPSLLMNFSHNLGSFIPSPISDLPSPTQVGRRNGRVAGILEALSIQIERQLKRRVCCDEANRDLAGRSTTGRPGRAAIDDLIEQMDERGMIFDQPAGVSC